MFIQLASPHLDDDASDQLAKNLFFIARCFHAHPFIAAVKGQEEEEELKETSEEQDQYNDSDNDNDNDEDKTSELDEGEDAEEKEDDEKEMGADDQHYLRKGKEVREKTTSTLPTTPPPVKTSLRWLIGHLAFRARGEAKAGTIMTQVPFFLHQYTPYMYIYIFLSASFFLPGSSSHSPLSLLF